jgi:hypothetical protein
MEIDYKSLKNIVEETVQAKRKCNDLICDILLKKGENLHSPLLSKAAIIFKKINDNPPVEVLKELEQIQLDE